MRLSYRKPRKPGGYEADEVYCKISSAEIAPESEIEADVDFWFENLKDLEEGANADFLAKRELSFCC